MCELLNFDLILGAKIHRRFVCIVVLMLVMVNVYLIGKSMHACLDKEVTGDIALGGG